MTNLTMANATSSTHRPSPSASLRKTNKPLMEKRRRARINDSLTQLKTLVMTKSNKDSSSFNKLEKADILELTVNHLRDLQGKQQQQQQQMSQNVGQDPAKYRAGFMECANEVICFLKQSQGFNDETKAKVVRHLAGCLQMNSQQTSYNRPTAAATIVTQNTAAPRLAVAPSTTAQLVNGQIIQIVNTPFQQNQAPIQQTSAPAAMLIASPNMPAQQQIIPSQVVTSSPRTQTSEPQHEQSAYNRFCQPLHIQIPPTKFSVLMKAPAQQQQVLAVRNIEERIPLPSKIESIDSSCPSSPFTNSPPSKSAAHKHLDFYAPTELHNDYLSRARTFSMTSSSSSASESDMMSPMNLSQSPPFCYSERPKEIIKPVASHQDIAMDQSSQNFTSVIKNTRKALDIPSAKYMRMMMEEEQRQQSVSPASSMGEGCVWRPW